jgi:small-conductance mechanosensitive channel
MIPQATVAGRRACALLTASSAVLHGIAALHADMLAAAVLMSAMGIACLFCARELWMHGALRTWTLVAVMNIAMIAVHTPFTTGHHHGGSVALAAMPTHHSMAMTAATALAAMESMIATAVVYRLSRHHRFLVHASR